MSFRGATPIEKALYERINDLEERITALENKRLRFGNFYIEQATILGVEKLGTRHATTGFTTIIGSQS